MLPFSRRSGTTADVNGRRPLRFRRALFLALLVASLGAALCLNPRPPAEVAAVPGVATSAPAEPELAFGAGHLFALALLLGGGVFAVHLRRGARSETALALLRPMEALTLAPNQQLRLVACGDDVLLLGVTGSAVTLLKSYPREAFESLPRLPEEETATGKESADAGKEASSSVVPRRDTFAEALRQRAVRSAMPSRFQSRPAKALSAGATC